MMLYWLLFGIWYLVFAVLLDWLRVLSAGYDIHRGAREGGKGGEQRPTTGITNYGTI
jgi:hypothetical protein